MLQLFKILADENRLKIVGILANGECSVGELAVRLEVKEPTISHHLSKLKEVGLVDLRRDGNTLYYRLDAESLRAISKEVLAPEALTPEKMAALVDESSGDAWERKVLRDFCDGPRLKVIPASRKQRLVILKWLAGQFEVGVDYREAQVNEILKRHHPDCATLRRELISEAHRLMQRENGIYRRLGDDRVSG